MKSELDRRVSHAWNTIAAWQEKVARAVQSTGAVRSSAGSATSPDPIAVDACLGMVQACNDGAMNVLFGAGSSWRAPFLDGGAPSNDAQTEAMKMLKLAELTLESPLFEQVRAMTSTPFVSAWPAVLTWGSLATVFYYSGRSRVALGYSERCIKTLSAVSPNPTQLVQAAIQATNSVSIAERVVSILASHSAILHRLGKEDQALPFAQLGVVLSTALHDYITLMAASKLAQRLQQRDKKRHAEHDAKPTEQRIVFPRPQKPKSAEPHSRGAQQGRPSSGEKPGGAPPQPKDEEAEGLPFDVLESRTPIGTLRAITLYNAALISEALLVPSAGKGKINYRRHPDLYAQGAQTVLRQLHSAKQFIQGEPDAIALRNVIESAIRRVERTVNTQAHHYRPQSGGHPLEVLAGGAAGAVLRRRDSEDTLTHLQRVQGRLRSEKAMKNLGQDLHAQDEEDGAPVALAARRSMLLHDTWLSELGL